MDDDVVVVTNDWKNTREAMAKFRRLLLCAKCSDLMKEPVCLGTCEHMLCRMCAGQHAGDGCVVCHSSVWVKDIQINRQLSSVIQLFCGLESLWTPIEEPETEGTIFKNKKSFKIWFSPRSRKVRCMVEKSPEVASTGRQPSGETTLAKPNAATAQSKDLTVFSFNSSSQDSSCSERCTVDRKSKKKRLNKQKRSTRKASLQRASQTKHKQAKETMKKKLEAINQQWGVTEEGVALPEKEQHSEKIEQPASKRVSFLSPAASSPEPQGGVNGFTHEAQRSAAQVNLSSSDATVLDKQLQRCPNVLDSVNQLDGLPAHAADDRSPEKQVDTPPPIDCSEWFDPEEEANSAETTPKRPRASPGLRRTSLALTSPAVLEAQSLTSSKHKAPSKMSRIHNGESPLVPAKQSPSNRACVGRSSSGSPAYLKKNLKGETPLHVSAIKGDVEAVQNLLDQGADPNLKDNAGWTPLHEACNLGHVAVVEMLVSRGALLNTPGYENDSPLHDAVRNGHTAIVKLLLKHGASQTVLNMYGKQPVDYARSLEMLEIFQETPGATENLNTSPNPSASISQVSDCMNRDAIVVFLPSKLSQSQQDQLARLGDLLEWTMADAFSSSVSHVVVPGDPMPTTYSTLRGLLAGCWIVKYSWVEACLQASRWMPENEYEAGDGARRSRINRCSLLPPLFDGCFFFLSGSFKAPTKSELTGLLREGGGRILSRRPKPDSDVTQTLSAAAYHAAPGSDQALCTQYVIFDPQDPYKPEAVRRGKVWSAPSSWLIDCIAAFGLLPVPNPESA